MISFSPSVEVLLNELRCSGMLGGKGEKQGSHFTQL